MRVLDSGALECDMRTDTDKLKRLIRSSSGAEHAGDDSTSGAMRVRRADGSHALSLRVTPLLRSTVNPFSPKSHAAILMKPTPEVQEMESILTDVYDLTPTEATIAGLLGSGRSVAEICEELDITPNTARTHLKRIYSKTDTNRQSALVSLIHSFPASVDAI